MKLKRLFLFGFILLIICSCQTKSPQFIVHYVGLDDCEGDTVYLWRLTADLMKSDKDYGRGPIDSTIVSNGQLFFIGKEDTLHMYEIEINDSWQRFYPERGELTLTHLPHTVTPISDKITHPHSLNEAIWKLWYEEGFPRDKTRRMLFANIQNAVGCFLLDRHAVVYPNELEDLYNRTNEEMRDTVSVLLSLNKQLKVTKAVQRNEPFFDFKQITFERDTLLFSNIVGKGEPTCLLFWLNANETNPVRKELDALKKQYPAMQLVVAILFYPDPQSQLFMQELKEQYGAILVDDGRRFEGSVRWLYRIHPTNFNYEYLFDGKGNLIKQQPLTYCLIDDYTALENKLFIELQKPNFSSRSEDYMKSAEYIALKSYILANPEAVEMMLDGFLLKSDVTGLNGYLIDDLVKANYPQVPSIVERFRENPFEKNTAKIVHQYIKDVRSVICE